MSISSLVIRTLSVAAVVVLLKGGTEIQAQRAGVGPTRIKIGAGLVTAEESRTGFVGVWEPDADLGLPPGSNHAIYAEDGLYINPFRNVALIGFWSVTADTLTMTPVEIRNLTTMALVPEAKEVFTQIAWDKPGTSKFRWLTPDRYQENGQREPRRRAKPVHDVTALHAAIVTDLLAGSWTDLRGVEANFMPGGAYREQMSGAVLAPSQLDAASLQVTVTGRYRFDAAAGVLQRTVEAVESAGSKVFPLVRDRILAAGRASGVLRIGARAPSSLRWINRNELMADGERWRR